MTTKEFFFFLIFLSIAVIMFVSLMILEMIYTFREKERKKGGFYKQAEIPSLEKSSSVEEYIKSIDGLKPLNKTKCTCTNSVCVANLSCICGNVKVKWDVYLIRYYIRDDAFLGTQIVNQSGCVISFPTAFKEIIGLGEGILLNDDTAVWASSSENYWIVTSQAGKRFGQ